MGTLIKYKQLLLDGKITNSDLAGGIATTKLEDGADFIKRTGTVPFTGDQSMGGNKLTNVANGTAAGDAVNYSQLLELEEEIGELEDLISEGLKTPIPFDASAASEFPTHPKGTTMKVTVAGTVSGVVLTVGDTLIYDADGSSPYVVQSNIDYATTTTAGYIRIGTTLEVNGGTDNTTAVTPYTLNERLTSLLSDLNGMFVRYDASQTLTPTEKTQARTNIGAAADDEVVKLSGSQTIAGTKTFSSSPVVPTGTAPTHAVNVQQLEDAIAAVEAGTPNIIFNEVPTGAINGVNTVFTLSNSAVAQKVVVKLNGQVLTPTIDYTHSGATITFVEAPDAVDTADIITVDYVKAS